MRSLVSEYDLVIAKTLPAALEMLGGSEPRRPIAGGTDLMVLFNAGKLPYERLVGIGGIPDLRSIEVTPDQVAIGAGVTYTEIRNHPILQSEFPLLCEAASWTGGVANQNRGTIAGNIANASPAADSAPMLLVYDAELELASRDDSRRVPYASFHVGYKQTHLRPGELITRVILSRKPRQVQYARKVGTRKAQAISKVSFAFVAHAAAGVLRDVRLALGSVAPVPLRCVQTEALLEGERLSPGVIAAAQETVAREIRPITDIRSTREYRTLVVTNLLGALLESL